MADKFDSQGGLESPFSGGQAVVGDVAFTQTSRALWVGGEGNLTVVTRDGTELTLVAVKGLLPGRITQVRTAGLTATNIVALW